MIVGKNLTGTLITLSNDQGTEVFRLNRSDALVLMRAIDALLDWERNRLREAEAQVRELKHSNAALRGSVRRLRKAGGK